LLSNSDEYLSFRLRSLNIWDTVVILKYLAGKQFAVREERLLGIVVLENLMVPHAKADNPTFCPQDLGTDHYPKPD
jgi:hypothetical protein